MSDLEEFISSLRSLDELPKPDIREIKPDDLVYHLMNPDYTKFFIRESAGFQSGDDTLPSWRNRYG